MTTVIITISRCSSNPNQFLLTQIVLFEHAGEGRHMWDITDDTYAVFQKVRSLRLVTSRY